MKSQKILREVLTSWRLREGHTTVVEGQEGEIPMSREKINKLSGRGRLRGHEVGIVDVNEDNRP